MRLTNVLIEGRTTRVIDFDDCGLGWHLYDSVAGISFIEDHPQIPALCAAWLQAYRRLRAIPDEDEAEMDTFILLRRVALLTWIGSHSEAPEPRQMAPTVAAGTAFLGQRRLASHGQARALEQGRNQPQPAGSARGCSAPSTSPLCPINSRSAEQRQGRTRNRNQPRPPRQRGAGGRFAHSIRLGSRQKIQRAKHQHQLSGVSSRGAELRI